MADPLASNVMIRAGREALDRGAPGTARHHLGAVVDLAGDDAPAEALLHLAQALRVTGDNQKAGDVCEQLLRRAEIPGSLYLEALCESRPGRVSGRPGGGSLNPNRAG